MNEVIKAIYERRSVRKFKHDKVPRELVEQVVDAGLYAPSGMGGQPTIIVAVTNKEMRNKLSEANRKIGGWGEDYDPFYGAPVVLIVLADKSHPTWQYDGPLVMENMMLAALGVEGDYEGIGHCVIGYDAYADDEYPEAAKRKDGRVFWVE